MCPQSSQAASQICCSKPIVADDDLDDFDFAMCGFLYVTWFFYYITQPDIFVDEGKIKAGPPHYTFFITFSRHPSCICFPEIDRFFAFVNSEKSAWTDGKNEPKPCGENMKVFLERNF